MEVDAEVIKGEVNADAPDNVTLSSQKSVTNSDGFRSSTKVDALLRNLKELREKDPSLRAIVFSQVSVRGILRFVYAVNACHM